MQTKIFGIGLSKTATNSLNTALKILGYTSVHFPVSLEEIDQNQASCDISVANRFRQLDRMYPGAKFILTVRDREDWLKSCQKHFEHKVDLAGLPQRLRKFIEFQRLKTYGTIEYDRFLFSQAYDKHLQEVKDHFAKRSQDLLIINIHQGESWQALCSFLQDKPIPNFSFPYENASCSSLETTFKEMTFKLQKPYQKWLDQ